MALTMARAASAAGPEEDTAERVLRPSRCGSSQQPGQRLSSAPCSALRFCSAEKRRRRPHPVPYAGVLAIILRVADPVAVDEVVFVADSFAHLARAVWADAKFAASAFLDDNRALKPTTFAYVAVHGADVARYCRGLRRALPQRHDRLERLGGRV